MGELSYGSAVPSVLLVDAGVIGVVDAEIGVLEEVDELSVVVLVLMGVVCVREGRSRAEYAGELRRSSLIPRVLRQVDLRPRVLLPMVEVEGVEVSVMVVVVEADEDAVEDL